MTQDEQAPAVDTLPAVNILPSIAEAALTMGVEAGGPFLYAITNYLLNGVIPGQSDLSDAARFTWIAIFPNLKISRKLALGRSAGGKKGGKASKRNNPNGRRGKDSSAAHPAPGGLTNPQDENDSSGHGLPLLLEPAPGTEIAAPPNGHKAPRPAAFVPPSVEEVQEYITANRYNVVDAAEFVDFYTSNGWMVGRNKMKDWRAAVRSWYRNKKNQEGARATQKTKNKPEKSARRDVNKIWENFPAPPAY